MARCYQKEAIRNETGVTVSCSRYECPTQTQPEQVTPCYQPVIYLLSHCKKTTSIFFNALSPRHCLSFISDVLLQRCAGQGSNGDTGFTYITTALSPTARLGGPYFSSNSGHIFLRTKPISTMIIIIYYGQPLTHVCIIIIVLHYYLNTQRYGNNSFLYYRIYYYIITTIIQFAKSLLFSEINHVLSYYNIIIL